ncbi:ERCC4 domain-containing protein [Clostridium sp. E02]|uniref:ERCC4 domain-containing protein n=1 Tax=Clostridium sp. E02 TaxID=2487134 RepID=UPI000F530A03|nr:ERCC4 domain-containing protein [Clostridium sp. E02]
MNIQIDSREKAKAIKKILAEFEDRGVDYYVSKLYVGDYMNLDNPRLIIDRKQNLTEVASNVCQDHKRFTDELKRAQEIGVKVIILVEHSNQIKSIDDVHEWNNPRLKTSPKAVTGEKLEKILKTMECKYDTQFLFCDKLHTGKKIIDLLGGVPSDSGRD